MRKQEQKGKITALYERLSHDDGRSDESVSVENQKRILEDYARKNGFTNVRHFTDDGVRGTTFKRPGLDAMVDEIRAGNVATVIVKDQSRIGRDVVEVGLLKRTFDEYNVRFIAANDNLDTANGFDIMSIFRDVINVQRSGGHQDRRPTESAYPGGGIPQCRGAAHRTSAGNGQSSFGACIAGTQRNC